MSFPRWISFLAVVLLLAAIFSCANDDDDDNDDQPDLVDPVPSDEAYELTGPTDDGRTILPNGRFISPVGQRVTVKRFPLSLALNKSGDRLYVATTKIPSLAIIDTDTMEVVGEAELPKHFGGLALRSDGLKLWIGGGSRQGIYEYDMGGDIPVLARTIPIFGYPIGLTLSADEKTMYVTLAYGKRVAVIDVETATEISSMNTGYYPHTIALAESLGRAVVSNWGVSSVSIFDLDSNELLADVEVGKNPEGVVLDQNQELAYVACSDTDDVHVIDLETMTTENVIKLYPDEEYGLGAIPTALAFSENFKQLYVTSSGFNCVEVIDVAGQEVVGRIPTEWYPSAVLPDDETLYVLNGKGIGSGPGNVKDPAPDVLPPEGGKLLGSVQSIPRPDKQTLEEYSEMVAENNSRTTRFYEQGLEFASPIPSERGKPSEQIKHVVFILKENKTFDQVLGDFPGVNADPDLTVFGKPYTPNLHKLSAEFTLCDNYYSESHDSDHGHSWATAAICNDYVEKAWVADNWTVLTGVEPGAMPASGFIFERLIENNISFRVYGEVVGTISNIEKLAPYLNFNYGFYNLAVSDRIKAAEVIREWEAGIFPSFIFILLPNDHTEGTTTGKPTMDYLVADNDAGLGMLVDWVSSSKYWPETTIFITQDDPQSGLDHVDAHRTPFTVVSPYAKRKYVSGVHYSMASMWLTIELILGLPAMTDYDRNTAPMYDLFTTEPNLAPYKALPSNIPYAENEPDAPMSQYCNNQDWGVPDQVERIAEVAWAYMRPGEPFPHYLHVAVAEQEDEDEEREEGRRYRQLLKRFNRYALEKAELNDDHLVGREKHNK